VDTRAVRDIYAEQDSGGEHGKFLWTLYVFAVWADRMREKGVLNSI
jgi:hypothetical protein